MLSTWCLSPLSGCDGPHSPSLAAFYSRFAGFLAVESDGDWRRDSCPHALEAGNGHWDPL